MRRAELSDTTNRNLAITETGRATNQNGSFYIPFNNEVAAEALGSVKLGCHAMTLERDEFIG